MNDVKKLCVAHAVNSANFVNLANVVNADLFSTPLHRMLARPSPSLFWEYDKEPTPQMGDYPCEGGITFGCGVAGKSGRVHGACGDARSVTRHGRGPGQGWLGKTYNAWAVET